MHLLGWFANLWIIAGLWMIGYRYRSAFLCTIIGEVLWAIKAYCAEQYDLMAICVVFALLAARNWWKWREP